MTIMPFALLAFALLLFLFSTRQIKLHWRGLIWLGGAVALGVAAWLAFGVGHTGLFAVLGDFFAHIGNPGDSVLAQSLGGNWASVGPAIGPMFDAFLILAVCVALVALVAFTPGEGVERAERPINIALIGAIAGGLIALMITSVGFGGVAKRKVYLNTVTAEDVIDGDTIRMGDISLRLWGIDAPERDQLCRSATGEPFECGGIAGAHLAELVAGKLVWCGPPVDPEGRRLPPAQLPVPEETYGRPIVMCRLGTDKAEVDIAQAMARDGYAHLYEDAFGVKSIYKPDVDTALRARAGLHAGEFLPPWLWRNDPAARCGFLDFIGFDKLTDRTRRSCLGFDTPANDNTASDDTATPQAAPEQ
ncbi:MAG: thermonuclease family protein [Hyphomonadaceae bacterium]|nr:thermonuclease family protein [Hyphomonadaceae bacterium]